MSFLALAACSATSDPILQLGIAPEQLAREEGSAAEGEAPEIVADAERGENENAASRDAAGSEAAGADSTSAEETASASKTKAGETKPASEARAIANASAATTGGETAGKSDTADETGDAADTTQSAEASDQERSEKRRSFLSAFFSPSPAKETAAARAIDESTSPPQADGTDGTDAPSETSNDAADADEAKADTQPLVQLASAEPTRAPLFGADALPGVRGGESLFEISHKSGIEDDSNVDVYEDVGSYQVASAAGMARLAPNGLLVQREGVDVSCFKPSLVRVLKTIEHHYRKKLVVTSGYRSPPHNRRVNGAKHSLHMSCSAADIQMTGVSKWELAKFARSMTGRGGVGTYCHTNSIHVDVGPQRDWNWRCSRRRK